MRRIGICLLAALVLSLSACGQSTPPESSAVSISPAEKQETAILTPPPSEEPESSAAASQESPPPQESGSTLIAYFSRVGNTDFPEDVDAVTTASLMRKDGVLLGNTQYIASLIQEHTGGDLFLIETKEKYPADYDETDAQARQENSENARPELATQVENLEQYDTVFLGFANWYYGMPMAVYSFLESHDLSGKTIVPFATSGGSGFSDAISVIQELQPNATVMEDGFLTTHSQVEGVQSADVQAWLDRLALN